MSARYKMISNVGSSVVAWTMVNGRFEADKAMKGDVAE
jgi:hypothetical protein